MVDSLWSAAPVIVNNLPAAVAAAVPDPHWTAYLTAFSTPLLALVAALIAFGQWQTANNKLKLDLFEKRMAAHQKMNAFWREFIGSGKITDESQVAFLEAVADIKWVFGREVFSHLDTTVWKLICQYCCVVDELEDLPRGAERTQLVKKKSNLRSDLKSERDVYEGLIYPYLFLGVNHNPPFSKGWRGQSAKTVK